jgi:riboflavin kinase/FMN adenylyltransferase
VVRGVVEHGDQRGRLLGFPTANLSIEGVVIPDGVWAGWFERASGERHGAAISIGSRPTFYGRDGARLIEVHVLDLDADLYDEVVTVWLVTRLRAQRRFKSIEALVEQLRADVTASRAWCTAGWQPDDTEVPLRVGQGLVLNGEMLAG